MRKKFLIDINCDMGEGFPNDEALMPYISSANIACGFHAGDLKTIRKTIALAQENAVNIGAHISFFDRENFGRTEMIWQPDFIEWAIIIQLQLIKMECERVGENLHHVKPHGALYNMAAKDYSLAKLIARTIFDFDKQLILYGLSGSQSIKAAIDVGLTYKNEVFADRRYQADGNLVSREKDNALIQDYDEAQNHVFNLLHHQKTLAENEQWIDIQADTICIHGDGVHAMAFAKIIANTCLNT